MLTTTMEMTDAMLRAQQSGSDVAEARPIYRYYIGDKWDAPAHGGHAPRSPGWPVRLWRRLTTSFATTKAAVSPSPLSQELSM